MPGASRARSRWQSFQQTHHGILCLLIERWVCLKLISTTKILTQQPGCLDTAVAQESHWNDKNDDNGAEVHSYNLQKSWKNMNSEKSQFFGVLCMYMRKYGVKLYSDKIVPSAWIHDVIWLLGFAYWLGGCKLVRQTERLIKTTFCCLRGIHMFFKVLYLSTVIKFELINKCPSCGTWSFLCQR